MNKRLVFVLFFIIWGTTQALAQVVDNSVTQEPAKPQEEVLPRRTKSSYNLISPQELQKQAEALLASEPAVSNFVEGRYDVNQDGKLQKDEIKAFFSDIVFAVERRGWIKINSPLLKIFDLDQDGRINRLESFEIKKSLR
ncbi:MAG: hypothetical protein HQL24_01435 [Candidatus Omnitrophica bacterium]|nr:hypothetical protein [Candidatus Omnitrophota bacterium]